MTDPSDHAWETLKFFVDKGATQEEVTELALQLRRGLPPVHDPESYAARAAAVAHAIIDIEGATDG